MKKVVLLTIVFMGATAFMRSQIPELLYYKFDTTGTSVQNYATSPVGNNPATITGTGLSIGSTGLHGSALVGTGVSASSGVINTGWTTNLSGSFTIAFWTSDIVPSSTLWYIWGDNGASSLRCFTNGAAGASNWLVRGGGLPDLIITNCATMLPNMIHVVCDASTMQLRGYVNGVLNATSNLTSTIAMSGTGFQIGGYSSNSNLNGKMDEYRIYNRALTQAEITATYNQTLGAATDASLVEFVNLTDSMCDGETQISVILKNLGPHQLTSVDIPWSVNGTPQTTHNWTGNLGIQDTTIVNIGTTNFSTGNTYNLKAYTDEPNNSPDTINNTNDTILKSITFIKPSPIATPSDSLIIACQGDSVHIAGTLTGSSPWNLTISDGTSFHNLQNINTSTYGKYFIPTANTTYTITSVKDATGCVNTFGPKTDVILEPAPPAGLNATGGTAKCQGDSVMLMASVGLNLTYEWFKDGVLIPGASNYVYGAKESGDYTVRISSPNGCKNTSSPVTVIIHPAPVVNLGKDTALYPDKSIKLDAGSGFTSYLWSTGASAQQIIVDSTGIGLGSKTIWVQVTDNFGCTGGDTITITFSFNPGIKDYAAGSDLKIVPNPTTGKITIKLPDESAVLLGLELHNAEGKKVEIPTTGKIFGQNQLSIELGGLPDGVYIIRGVTNSSTYTGRFIIQK